MQTARHKAIDAIRRDRRKREARAALGHTLARIHREEDDVTIRDDLLRLIFTCCHPALSIEARLALTLRTVVGLPTADIARAF